MDWNENEDERTHYEISNHKLIEGGEALGRDSVMLQGLLVVVKRYFLASCHQNVKTTTTLIVGHWLV